jgi:hypothetical protein
MLFQIGTAFVVLRGYARECSFSVQFFDVSASRALQAGPSAGVESEKIDIAAPVGRGCQNFTFEGPDRHLRTGFFSAKFAEIIFLETPGGSKRLASNSRRPASLLRTQKVGIKYKKPTRFRWLVGGWVKSLEGCHPPTGPTARHRFYFSSAAILDAIRTIL